MSSQRSLASICAVLSGKGPSPVVRGPQATTIETVLDSSNVAGVFVGKQGLPLVVQRAKKRICWELR